MKNSTICFVILVVTTFFSCSSSKFSIQNADNAAIKPQIKNNAFVLTEYGDANYGHTKNYPINLGFDNERTSEKNIDLFFNALQGQNGEKITYKKIEVCCPFSTKRSLVGAGMLQVYEISFEGNTKKEILYLNMYDKGKVLCPKKFSIKK